MAIKINFIRRISKFQQQVKIDSVFVIIYNVNNIIMQLSSKILQKDFKWTI